LAEPGLGEHLAEPLGSGQPLIAGVRVLLQLPLDLDEPVAAVAGQLDREAAFRLPQLAQAGR